MNKGQRVTWTEPDHPPGFGVVIVDEVEGHVTVAVDRGEGMAHPVIWCATTWLTPVGPPPPEPLPEKQDK